MHILGPSSIKSIKLGNIAFPTIVHVAQVSVTCWDKTFC